VEKIILRELLPKDEDDIQKLKKMELDAFKDGAIDEWVIKPIIRYGKILKLEKNNEIIGFVELLKSWNDFKEVYIFSFIIDKTYQNKGYGKKMLFELIKYLKKERIKKICLTVSPDNIGALKLYKNYNFKEIKLYKNEYGINTDRIYMELSI